MEAIRDRREAEKEKGTRTQVPGQTSVLQFLSKLRRHASLEGAGPYFKRWKFDSSHRAASLDAKGLAKRHARRSLLKLFKGQGKASCCPLRSRVRISEEETLSEAEGSE